jgi:hypothetical protein
LARAGLRGWAAARPPSSRPADSPESAQAARGTPAPRTTDSPEQPTAPERPRRPADWPWSAPARRKPREAARQARLQTKPAASCDRTQHRGDATHARSQTDPLCTLRLPNRRRACCQKFSIAPPAIMPPVPEMQRPPRGAARLRAPRRSHRRHSIPDDSRLPRPRRKPAKPRPQTQSAMSAHADDSGVA